MKKDASFWNATPLSELSKAEWEALCDGCGKCCLHKLEDEDDGEIFYTDLVCHFINLDSCTCSDYKNRHINVPNCIAFNADDIANMHWLPKTCAYLLRYNNQPLFDWHYLISGDKNTIHQQQQSIKHFAQVDQGQEVEEHVVYFDI